MAFIPAVGTVPVGEEAVPSTITVVTEVTGSASAASAASGDIFLSPLLDGSLDTASNLRGNISVVGPISGKANTASDGVAELLTGELMNGSLDSASSATAVLSQVIAATASGSATSDLSGSIDIAMSVTGGAPSASDGLSYLGVPVRIQGGAPTSATARGQLTDPEFRQWRLIDPETNDIYLFETNPATVPSNFTKLITESRNEQGNTLVFKRNGPSRQVRITGSLLSENQLSVMTDWSKKRYPVTLRDDLGREITIYVESFDATREHKIDHDWFNLHCNRIGE